jgi:hypothetical protein
LAAAIKKFFHWNDGGQHMDHVKQVDNSHPAPHNTPAKNSRIGVNHV